MPLLLALILGLFSNSAFAAVPATNGTESNPSNLHIPEIAPVPPREEKPSFVIQTIITVCISIATTILTGLFQERGRRQQMLQKEFTDAIRELREFSEAITQQVVDHLSPSQFTQSHQKTSHSTILLQLKLCGNRMCRAADLLDKSDHAQLEAEFLKWKAELTSAPFPIQRRECVCQPHDAPVQRIHAAQEVWNKHLDLVTRECIGGSIKIPLNHKN